MRATLIAGLLASTLAMVSGGCIDRTAKSGTNAPSNCLKDLNTIPELAAVLKSRKHDSEEPQGRPFEGLELALTINGMVISHADPDADADDLCFTENTPENLDRLANALESNGVPPTVSFIQGRWLDVRMQKEWLRRGNLVGSFGYDKPRERKTDAEEFIRDVARNDAALGTVWGGNPPTRKYFRFPRTKLRRDPRGLDAVKTYLKKNQYVIVPATIDLLDTLFSQLYCSALSRGDQSCANLIKANFRSLALDTTLKARSIANNLAGHNVKQILVVAANQFTCDNLSELVAWYKSLGARFITLDEALSDPFYASSDAEWVIEQTRSAQLTAAEKR
ncbi:MAG TPA: polysaccharide deacetylase family protein [Blastocatellia bacterium]|nr:polysaccharide deacetylase family protein [Blastocatellia bacterium]